MKEEESRRMKEEESKRVKEIERMYCERGRGEKEGGALVRFMFSVL